MPVCVLVCRGAGGAFMRICDRERARARGTERERERERVERRTKNIKKKDQESKSVTDKKV